MIAKRQFSDLPNYKTRQFEKYLCAVQFSDGVVKVGCTWSPQQRLRQLRTALKRDVTRVAWVGLSRGHWHARECVTLAICRRLSAKTIGHEWFHGLHFGEVANAIKAVAKSAA